MEAPDLQLDLRTQLPFYLTEASLSGIPQPLARACQRRYGRESLTCFILFSSSLMFLSCYVSLLPSARCTYGDSDLEQLSTLPNIIPLLSDHNLPWTLKSFM